MTESRIEDVEDIEVEVRKNPMTGAKPHSTPLTLKWLEDNYETSDGVCIPRSTLYLHYLEFCQDQNCNPVNAASFGKIIRQQFPQITTRRLGTRGQSKYHYYGIAVRESSPYYDVIYSAKGVQSSGEGKKENTKQMVAYSPRSKLGTLLPSFPGIQDMAIPQDMDQDKVATFLVMYRTHCQRILDTVIRANFDEVENFLHHFWQGMPGHMTSILATPFLTTVIALCDSILYKTLCDVLMPSVVQPLPESLTQVIGQFADRIDRWVDQAMTGMADTLKDTKMELSRQFSQTMRRQLSVNHLVQATRNVLTSNDVTAQMLSDWLTLDLGAIAQQTLYTMGMEDGDRDRDYSIIWNLCTDIEKLLDNQSPVEPYIECLDEMLDTWLPKSSPKTSSPTQNTARQFLLLWTCFSSRVIRDMTIQSVPSFGSFHLLHLMLDDYVLYRIQRMNANERQERYKRIVIGQIGEEDVKPEVILPDTSQVTLPLGPFITSSNHPGNFLHHPIFPESFFDYGSSSEFCTSDEDDDEGLNENDESDDNDDAFDEEEDDDDEEEKFFIPSPLGTLRDNSLNNRQISTRKDFSQTLTQQNNHSIYSVHLQPRHHQQLQQRHPHHPYQPPLLPPSQQPRVQNTANLPWKISTDSLQSPRQLGLRPGPGPGQNQLISFQDKDRKHVGNRYKGIEDTVCTPLPTMGGQEPHPGTQEKTTSQSSVQNHQHLLFPQELHPQQHFLDLHHHHNLHTRPHQPQHQTISSHLPYPTDTSTTIMNPGLLPYNHASPFHWISSTPSSSSSNQIQPSFMTNNNNNNNNSCTLVSLYQQPPPMPTPLYRFPAINNHQDMFTSPSPFEDSAFKTI